MLRRFALVAIAVLGVSFHLHGQTLPGAPTRPTTPVYGVPPPPRTGAVLMGQIVDASSGRAVPRAIVRLIVRGNTLTRVTDEKGRFYFVNVPDSNVELVASKTGFFDGAYGKQRAGGAGIPLTVTSGGWFSDLRIELFKSAAISGVVSDEVNEPVTGVRVRAWRREFVEGREQLVPAGEAITDDDGAYRIFDLLPASYIVSVPSVQVTLPSDALERALTTGLPTPELAVLFNLNGGRSPDDRLLQPNGKHVLAVGRSATPPRSDGQETYAYHTEFYPGTETPSFAIPVIVGPSEDRTGVHFQLRLVPTHTVSGVVVGPNGRVPNQMVRLVFEGVDDQGFGNEAAVTVTDADGAFTLLNVPEGRYTLQAREVAGLAGAAPPVDLQAVPLPVPARTKGWGQLDVAVSTRDLMDLVVTVRPPPTLKGRVVLESSGQRRTPVNLASLSVSLLPEQRTIGAALTRSPTSTGTFAFPELAAGSYFVRMGPTPAGWSLKAVTSNGVDLLDRPLELDEDAEVTITLTDRASEIWGTARDARGAPAVGATILLLPPASSGRFGLNPNRVRETRAATSGVFNLGGLAPGDYFVLAIDDAQADGWQDPARAEALRARATRVSVREAEQKMVDLRLVRR
jgi:hypothetical protein